MNVLPIVLIMSVAGTIAHTVATIAADGQLSSVSLLVSYAVTVIVNLVVIALIESTGY